MHLELQAVRTVNYAASVLVFGELAFTLLVAPQGERSRPSIPLIGWSLAAAIVSAAAWLSLEAGHMSGLPLHEAMHMETLRTVAGQTVFGEICSLRIALFIAIAALLPSLRHGGSGATKAAFALALVAIACLAGTGHAVTSNARLAVDAFHVVAAGAWVGALPAFARAMGESIRHADAAAYPSARVAALRFSSLGITCVATLMVSGLVNASFSLPTINSVYESPYGQLLLVKLALFAAMLALAVVNRVRHSTALVPHPSSSVEVPLHALRRNALIEFALGVGIVIVVAQLGITMPPTPMASMHVH